MPFPEHAAKVLMESGLGERLKYDFALVLEKLARGGGATDWYLCRTPLDLEVLPDLVRPGSILTWYFKEDREAEQLRVFSSIADVSARVQQVIGSRRDCLLALVPQAIERLKISYVDYIDELDSVLATFLRARRSSRRAFQSQQRQACGCRCRMRTV